MALGATAKWPRAIARANRRRQRFPDDPPRRGPLRRARGAGARAPRARSSWRGRRVAPPAGRPGRGGGGPAPPPSAAPCRRGRGTRRRTPCTPGTARGPRAGRRRPGRPAAGPRARPAASPPGRGWSGARRRAPGSSGTSPRRARGRRRCRCRPRRRARGPPSAAKLIAVLRARRGGEAASRRLSSSRSGSVSTPGFRIRPGSSSRSGSPKAAIVPGGYIRGSSSLRARPSPCSPDSDPSSGRRGRRSPRRCGAARRPRRAARRSMRGRMCRQPTLAWPYQTASRPSRSRIRRTPRASSGSRSGGTAGSSMIASGRGSPGPAGPSRRALPIPARRTAHTAACPAGSTTTRAPGDAPQAVGHLVRLAAQLHQELGRRAGVERGAGHQLDGRRAVPQRPPPPPRAPRPPSRRAAGPGRGPPGAPPAAARPPGSPPASPRCRRGRRGQSGSSPARASEVVARHPPQERRGPGGGGERPGRLQRRAAPGAPRRRVARVPSASVTSSVEDVVGGEPVRDRAGAGGVVGDHPAERRPAAGGDVRPEEQAVGAGGGVQPVEHHAGPDARGAGRRGRSRASSRAEQLTTSPAPTAWPARLVPAPRMVSGTPWSRQAATAASRSSASAGAQARHRQAAVDARVGRVELARGRRRRAPRPRRPGEADATRPAASMAGW